LIFFLLSCIFSSFFLHYFIYVSLHLYVDTLVLKEKKVHYLNVICKLNMWLENAVYYVEFSMIQIHFFVSVHAWFSFHLNVRGKRCCFYLFYFILSFFIWFTLFCYLIINHTCIYPDIYETVLIRINKISI
jgi:hypothetical protein